ncbi:MATE family efflux transporter [Paenibacillus xylaniclasticus]|uniref:MATE family efflux transporter n=1 Tax=Paenibacillus xylaniclasticus TaxID=588083 RepID=UPI000FD71505|nr:MULTISPECIES: MATE family efflux transporter [Paenibacillus]GFN29986.1 MATE family efflux transporter [Paenibacillus curdlanolyticus]
MAATSIRKDRSLSLFVLTWPIAIELLLQFLMGTVDSMMISRLGDNAVSAVGLSNQVLRSLLTVFVLINGGAGIVIARRWGAGKPDEARRAAAMGLKVCLIAGALISVLFAVGAGQIVRLMGAPAEVAPMATTYLAMIGACSILTEINMMTTVMIRNTGNTRGPMMIAIGMNVIHIILNYGFIFGELGLPQMGIEGLGISTIISRLLAVAAGLWLLFRSFPDKFRRSDWRGYDKPILKEMIGIGLPNLGTAASWGYSQIVQLAIISSLGAMQLAANSYFNIIQQLPWLVGQSIGMAVQIQVGQLFGAKQYDDVYRAPYRAALVGILPTIALAILLYSLGDTTLRWFTSDDNIIAAVLPLFFWCIIWQPMRTWTYAFMQSMNAIGEAKFVALNTVLGMWIFATGGAYVFGVLLDMGIMGALVGLMLDELFRAAMVGWRWKGRRKLPKQSRAGLQAQSADGAAVQL